MTYSIVKKEQNIAGDWTVSVDANGTLLTLNFGGMDQNLYHLTLTLHGL